MTLKEWLERAEELSLLNSWEKYNPDRENSQCRDNAWEKFNGHLGNISVERKCLREEW